MPTISVLMPAYNAGPFIAESIQSILDQSYSDLELIIVDDGSTDDTSSVAQQFADPRIVFIPQEHLGISAALNTAMAVARGEYITFQAADDISLKSRLERSLAQFSDDIIFVHTDMLVSSKEGEIIGMWRSTNVPHDRVLRTCVRIGTPFNNGTIVVRRSVLMKALFDTALVIGEDTAMIVALAGEGKSSYLADPLYVYRRTGSNASGAPKLNHYVAFKSLAYGYPLESYVTEVEWEASPAEAMAQAKAIVALWTNRRGFRDEAERQFKELRTTADSPFIRALHALAGKNWETARTELNQVKEAHLRENYLGEIESNEKRWDSAAKHFLRASALRPGYAEPLDNLRQLGMIIPQQIYDGVYTKLAR